MKDPALDPAWISPIHCGLSRLHSPSIAHLTHNVKELHKLHWPSALHERTLTANGSLGMNATCGAREGASEWGQMKRLHQKFPAYF